MSVSCPYVLIGNTLENMLSTAFTVNFPPSFFCTYTAISSQYINLICTYIYSPGLLLLCASTFCRLNPFTQCIATYHI